MEERKFWKDYMHAYEQALSATSHRRAPWYIVPADDKRVRDLLIARTIADALDEMGLRYPAADPSVKKLGKIHGRAGVHLR